MLKLAAQRLAMEPVHSLICWISSALGLSIITICSKYSPICQVSRFSSGQKSCCDLEIATPPPTFSCLFQALSRSNYFGEYGMICDLGCLRRIAFYNARQRLRVFDQLFHPVVLKEYL